MKKTQEKKGTLVAPPQIKTNPAAIIEKNSGQLSLLDLAERIQQEHELCENAFQSALLHAKQAGEMLIEAKAQVKHGEWLPWLKANCRFSQRTASRYIKLANRWDELAFVASQNPLSVRQAFSLLASPDRRKSLLPSEKPLRFAISPKAQALKADIDTCHTWLHRAASAINEGNEAECKYWVQSVIAKLESGGGL